jgi:hypothetical protein
MGQHAMARHCGNKSHFVHDSARYGIARKRRPRAQVGDLNATADVAGKHYNYMKNK